MINNFSCFLFSKLRKQGIRNKVSNSFTDLVNVKSKCVKTENQVIHLGVNKTDKNNPPLLQNLYYIDFHKLWFKNRKVSEAADVHMNPKYQEHSKSDWVLLSYWWDSVFSSCSVFSKTGVHNKLTAAPVLKIRIMNPTLILAAIKILTAHFSLLVSSLSKRDCLTKPQILPNERRKIFYKRNRN